MAFSQTALTEREYYFTTLPDVEPPSSFTHTPAADKPASPAFPDDLNDAEQAEVRAWLSYGTTPTLTKSIAKVAAYVANYKAMDAWRIANDLARKAQYRWMMADAAVVNKPTTTPDSSTSGTPTNPPPAHVPPQGTQP